MKQLPILGSMAVLLAGVAWAGESPNPAKKATTLEALQADIEALKPAQHTWRAIAWRTCPLEALKEAREQKKPVIAWVFLGIPTDERC
jgi:hypothetical protein